MTCNISFNLSAICIPTADKLLDQARKTSNPAMRQKLY